MKNILILLLISLNLNAKSISEIEKEANEYKRNDIVYNYDYSSIDSYVKSINTNTNDVYTLHNILTKNCKNNIERVRAFYIWLTHNIEYYSYNVTDKSFLTLIMNDKKGDCDVISGLFNELCRISDIESVMLIGKIKGYGDDLHAWNCVKINNIWYSIDATFGLVKTNKTDFYFATPPSIICETHYPFKYTYNETIYTLFEPMYVEDLVDKDLKKYCVYVYDTNIQKENQKENVSIIEEDKIDEIFNNLNIGDLNEAGFRNLLDNIRFDKYKLTEQNQKELIHKIEIYLTNNKNRKNNKKMDYFKIWIRI